MEGIKKKMQNLKYQIEDFQEKDRKSTDEKKNFKDKIADVSSAYVCHIIVFKTLFLCGGIIMFRLISLRQRWKHSSVKQQ